jgi:hypothetical protein
MRLSKRKYLVIIVYFISILAIIIASSVYLPFFMLIQNEGDLNQEINPSIVNGILTATSIFLVSQFMK